MKKIYVIRHGMRLDHEDRNWKQTAARPYDPPLSEKGLQQAHQTGRYLKQFSVHALYASPFLRTLQTATQITQTLDLDIQVEPGLSEWLNPKWYDFSAGLPALEARQQTFPRLDLGYQPLVQPRFPEHEEEICAARCHFVARQLRATTDGDIALISHGACVKNIIQGLTGSLEGFNSQTCVVHVLEQNANGQWKVALTTTEHLNWQEEKVEFI